MSGWLNQTPDSYAQALFVCFRQCEDERVCKEPQLSVLGGLCSDAGDREVGRLLISCPAPWAWSSWVSGKIPVLRTLSQNPVLAKQNSPQGLKMCD